MKRLLLLMVFALAACGCDDKNYSSAEKFLFDVPYPGYVYYHYYPDNNYSYDISFEVTNPTKKAITWIKFYFCVVDTSKNDQVVWSDIFEYGSKTGESNFIVQPKKKAITEVRAYNRFPVVEFNKNYQAMFDETTIEWSPDMRPASLSLKPSASQSNLKRAIRVIGYQTAPN